MRPKNAKDAAEAILKRLLSLPVFGRFQRLTAPAPPMFLPIGRLCRQIGKDIGCAIIALALAGFHSICSGEAEWQPPSPVPIKQLKQLYPQTVLVRDGQPHCIVVTPDEPEYDAPARRFGEIVRRRTGALPNVMRDTVLVDDNWNINYAAIAGKNLVALGNVNNNRLLSALYGQRYVVEDSIYPGEGGYVIRTVHDPFAKGANVLVLAGSNVAGVEKAIWVFAEKYANVNGKDLILPQPIIDVRFEKKAYRFFPDASDSLSSKRQPQYTGMDWFREQLRQEGFMDATGKVIENHQTGKTMVSLTGMIARIGHTYFRTGNPDLPPLMKDLLDKNRRLLEIPEPLNEMGARAAWHIPEWDLLEELPVWTDQDRLDITNALLKDAAIGHERRDFHKQAAAGAVMAMDENHGTCSALNSFVAWQYFHKYYPSPASEYWMRCAKAVFSAQASTYQIPEDAAGYLCYCPTQTMNYALRAGDLTYFKRGIARHHAQYIATACMNNLGLSTGFGDDGSVVSPEFFEALAPAAWFYRDPELYWVVRNKLPTACGLRIFQNSIAFDLSVEPREPREWTGLIRVPLYEAPLTKGNSSRTPIFAEKKAVDPKLFNKLVFRENWDQNGQYLLLDGTGTFGDTPGPHGHKHDDINTIINFTAQGRMWLVDHTYQVRSFQDHSGLYVLCNGAGGYSKGAMAELKDLVDAAPYGLSRTRFMNWERAIFWKKGNYFLVIDTAIADKPGDYFARCSLRALGEAEIRGPDLYLSQKGKFCKILSDGRANLDLERYPFTDSQWKTFYPYAEPTVRILQEDKARQLKAGERIGFINLLYAYGSKETENRVRMKAVSESCAIVEEDGEETLVGIGEIPGGIGVANMFVLSKDAVILPGADKELLARRDLAQKALAAAHEQIANVAKKADHQSRPQETKGLEVQTVKLGMAIRTLAVADLDGDGTKEWIVGGDDGVGAFKPDGVRLWHFATKRSIRCLDIADLDGDGRPEIAVGGEDEFVHLLDRTGKERWLFQCKKSNDSISGPPAVDYVKIADLEGSGKKQVVVGANWVHVLDASGKVVWEKYMAFRRGRICGDFIAGDVSDVNGDGKQEITALFMTSYPLAIIYDSAGNIVMPADGPGGHGGLNIDVPFAVATTDLFGGGKTRQIVCGCASQIGFYWHDQRTKEQAGGAIKGAFVAMACLKYSPTQPAMIFGADSMCGITGILPELKRNDRWINARIVWYRNLGVKVTALLAAQLTRDGSGQVIVGTKKGDLYVLDAKDGSLRGQARLDEGRITALTFDAASRSVLAGTSEGSLARIQIRENQP